MHVDRPPPASFDVSSDCFRACTDVDSTLRDCMDFPDFAPSAAKL